MTVKVYGLNNCDTCRKAKKWLDAEGIAFEFHDLRKSPIDGSTLEGWLAAIGTDGLINRRGTTWRGLSDGQKGASGDALVSMLLDQIAILKRPIFVAESGVSVGFDDAQRKNMVAQK